MATNPGKSITPTPTGPALVMALVVAGCGAVQFLWPTEPNCPSCNVERLLNGQHTCVQEASELTDAATADSLDLKFEIDPMESRADRFPATVDEGFLGRNYSEVDSSLKQ